MKYTAEEICEKLHLDHNQILNIYPYGSQIYLSSNEYSDSDFIIVYKQSLLPSGAFRDNAITSDDCDIQGVCYSKGGFIDAINNYYMSALEAIFLPDEMVVQKKFNFKLNKYNQKDMVRNIISFASSSWHNVILSFKDDNFDYVKKNVYHSLRALKFGLQIKEHGKIVDYTSTNNLKRQIYDTVCDCDPKDWYPEFIELSNILKS